MEKEEVLNEIKAHLQAAHSLSLQHAQVINNNSMHVHIASIANKWLGGIHTVGILEESPLPVSNQRVVSFTPEDFKKKPELKKSRIVAADKDDLSSKSLSELKVMAKEANLDWKGRDKTGIIEMIRFNNRAASLLNQPPVKHEEEE